jgi:protein SCO1/2
MTFRSRLCTVALTLLVAPLLSRAATASLTAAQLASVGVNPGPSATLPLDTPLTRLDGRLTTLRGIMGDRAAVVIFTDYRCTQLCSPILAVTEDALEKTGLDPERDYRLIVVGFNPLAGADDARQMIGGQIGFDTPVGRATVPLMANEPSLQLLTSSVGYHYAYDAENKRYAHPAALLIVTPVGRLSRILTGLSITGDDARSALIEAKSGRLIGLVNQVRLLCYGLGASVGRYSGAVRILLAASGAATVLVVAIALLLLSRRGARGRA